MIKAILIDDEVHCVDTLNMLISDYCPEVQVMEQCVSARQGLAAVNKYHPELIFLDIEMPGMNVFEFLEQFKEIPFSVIFTTSYDQYAIKAIRFSALDYLLKPIDPKELVMAVEKVRLQKIPPSPEQLLKETYGTPADVKTSLAPQASAGEKPGAPTYTHCEPLNLITDILSS